MPTTNPRLMVTVTPAVAAVLAELSEVTGNSRSAIVGDLLAMSVPVFERMVQGIRAAKALQEEAPAEIVAGLERAHERLGEQLGIAIEGFDDGLRPLLDQAEKVQRRSARRVSTPVPVTRGSGHGKTRKSGSRKGRGRG